MATAPGFQTTVTPVSEGFYSSPEYMAWAQSVPKQVVDVNTGYQSAYFGALPGGTFGPTQDAAYEKFMARGGAVPTLTPAIALDLLYRSSTVGAPTAEFDSYGGYGTVKTAAQEAGYTGTPQNLQNYEIANNLLESASTKLNKQFIGTDGEIKLAQLEANLNSSDPAIAQQTKDNLATQRQAAEQQVITEYRAANPAAQPATTTGAAAAQATTGANTAMTITQAYQQVLGRTPNAQEIAYWTTQFGPDVDAAELSTFSTAAQPERAATPTTNAAIQQMYRQVLGREPDAAGLKYFSDRFGTDVDATELGIFKGMSTQEIAANAAQQAAANTGGDFGIEVTVEGPDGTVYGNPAAARAAGVTNYTMGSPATGATTAAGMSIAQAYQQVLGRTPNASEIAYWTTQFGASVDPTELSTFSTAAQPERAATPTTNNAVRQMYLSVLGREPDAAGLKYFSDRFGADVDATELGIFRGMSTQEIAANAAKTGAGTTTGTGATTTGMSITQAYQQVLGRTPNAQEIAYWTTQFGSSVDPKELSTFSVAAQPERAAVPTTNNAIRQMYLSVLGREPDASGLKYFSDRFGADVDATELGIFRGMSTQEIAANAARNAGTTAGTTAGGLTRPTTPTQVTGTQLAPATTGTGFTNIYTPATMQQNAPTLASIQAAAQSANPYASLMALSPQRAISPAYAAQAGQTTANTNLGGFNSAAYNPAAITAAPSGLLTTTDYNVRENNSSGDYGGTDTGGTSNTGTGTSNTGTGTSNTGTGQTGYGTVANLSGEAARIGATTIGGLIADAIPVGATYNKTDLTTGLPVTGSFTTADLAVLDNKDAIAAITSQNQAVVQDTQEQSSSSPFDGGSYGGYGGDTGGGDTMGFGGDYAKGGMVNMRPQRRNPPGPDDGYAALDNGEYVIRKSAVKKYGSNIFEKINAGQIPARRLKSLLE